MWKDIKSLVLKSVEFQVFAAVAHERALVPHGVEVDLFPGAAHVEERLGVREDGVEGLGDLVHVEEAHWGQIRSVSGG